MFEFEADFYDSKSQVQYNLGLKLIEFLNVQNNENILDIGCGPGRLTLEIAKMTPDGVVIGVDYNQDMIIKALENLWKSGLTNTQFLYENILQYEPQMQFNAIFSNSALHWIQETQELYQKIYTLLAPGGRLVAQMPAKGSLDKFISAFMVPIQPLGFGEYFRNWSYPIKFIIPKALQRILSSIGYIDMQIWEEDQEIQFQTSQEVLDFLKTASIVPILSQLPPEKRDSYLSYLLDIINQRAEELLSVTMRRLFVIAKKGVE